MVTIEDITAGIENTTLISNGVSFAGQSLKLDTEADAKPVVEAIENCSSLDFLNLQGNTLGVDASRAIAKALEKHPEFKKAIWLDMFTGRMKTEIPKALQFLGNGLVTANARLTLLDLSDNAFGPIGVEGLASLLRSSSCYALEELKLNNNGLGIDGGKLLSRALLDCYRSSKNEGKALALKVFVAGRNRLENDGAKALAEVFQTIGTLEEIAMPQNGIYDVGITALSQSFRNNPNLKILNLNDNTFGQKGSKAIALVLPYLKELKEINFGDCLLKNSGALSLAEGLKHCDKLEKLTLEANEIRTEGGVQLIKVLMDKKNLISVNLNANHFGNRGKDEINALLKDVGKVETLDTLSGDESIESDDNEGDGDCEEHEQESNSECEGKNEEKGVQISCFSNYRHSVKFDSSGSEDDIEEDKQDSDSESESKTNRTTIPTIIVAEFLNKPTSENFSVLGPDPAKLFLQDLNKNGSGSVIEKLFMIVMKVASLNVCKDKLVCERSLKCTDSLYQYIFGVSNEESLPLINNTLLVYLGMIKNEDKFKPTWNIDGCLKALHNAVKKNYVPDNTKNTLKMFLQKDIENGKEFSNIKKDILTDLN